MTLPLVSIIVLNYNGKHFLDDNLSSLMKQSYTRLEVILVDNASEDGSVEYVQKMFPKVKIVVNDKNTGFPANNLGIQASTADYIMLLNNDTVVDHHMVEESVKELVKNDEIGMGAVKILSMGQANILDSIGINIYPDGMSRQRGRLEKDTGQYDRVEDILIPSGCGGFYKKEMLDEIGLLDEDFFAYCEDTDLGFRGRLAGWKTISIPSARVYHHYSGSFKKVSSFKAFLVERNHLWFAVKCFPATMLLTLPFYTFYRFAVQIYAIVTGQGMGGKFVEEQSSLSLVGILVRAYCSAFAKLPAMLKKRKAIQKSRKVTTREVKQWFKKHRITARDLTMTG
ncbi:MAG: glycosyl transferase [bacterium]|nr:MAG: glycosyl transferase [bacterium]